MARAKTEDPAMARVRAAVEASGLTQQELGERMGYAPGSARKSVSQFLRSGDPHVSMVRKVAGALGIDVCELVRG